MHMRLYCLQLFVTIEGCVNARMARNVVLVANT